jgi:hypothetical protein
VESYITSDARPAMAWSTRLGASSPRVIGFPGIALSAAAAGTGPCTEVKAAVAHAVPRVRGEVAFAAPTQPDAAVPGLAVVAGLLGQTNIHNSMTRAYASGEGASGPPPQEEPV